MSHSRLTFAAAAGLLVLSSACAGAPALASPASASASRSASGSGESSAPALLTPSAAAATPALGATAAAAGIGAAPAALARGKATFESVCSSCHDAAVAADLRNTRDGWQQVVDRMFGFGLAANGQQVREIVDYLAYTYPAT